MESPMHIIFLIEKYKGVKQRYEAAFFPLLYDKISILNENSQKNSS